MTKISTILFRSKIIMVKHFLCILFSVITLNHSHCQYLYEEFTFMWQSIDSVKYELEKDSFQLTKTLKDEHCIFNAFKKEAKHISFECCNETKDSITSIKEITSDFSHLLGIHKQLRLNENLEHTDTTICQYPTKVYRDDLDYEIVLVFDSEMDIYSYQINYFSDFEFIKTNIESIFNCDDSNTYLDRVLQIFEAENSKGNSIKSHFTSAPRIEYHSFENFSSQILDFRNSPEYDDLLKEYQK